MKQKKLFFCRPAYIFFIILLMMPVLTINAYYFYDNFGDNVILTSPWTEKFYSRGSENLDPDPALEFKSEAGGQLLISGTRDANGGWMGDGIMQGPFNASADKPFGVQIDIASFNPGSGRSEIEITLFKDAAQFASVVLYYDGDNTNAGYIWRDGLTEAPSSLSHGI